MGQGGFLGFKETWWHLNSLLLDPGWAKLLCAASTPSLVWCETCCRNKSELKHPNNDLILSNLLDIFSSLSNKTWETQHWKVMVADLQVCNPFHTLLLGHKSMCLWPPFSHCIFCASPKVQLRSFLCPLQLQKEQFILTSGEKVFGIIPYSSRVLYPGKTKKS